MSYILNILDSKDFSTTVTHAFDKKGIMFCRKGSFFRREKVPTSGIKLIQVLTQLEGVSIGNAALGAGAGAFIFGPLGLFAGLLTAKKNLIYFKCELKDGRSFTGSCNAKAFWSVMQARPDIVG